MSGGDLIMLGKKDDAEEKPKASADDSDIPF
jgi:hypothetical protein